MNSKLYILCGIPFSGKTTLAKELERRLGFFRIDLDDVKFELLGKDIKDENVKQYQWDKVYLEMYQRIEKALREGKTVVCDTGNFTKYERSLVKNIADKLGIETQVIFVDLPVTDARKRWVQNKENNNRFDITEKSFEEAVNEMEPPKDNENFIVYDSSRPIEELINNLGIQK